ncbi:MAG: pyruvate,orthophosphate dikinase [Chlamydiales bacterium]|jgi:pyruvate,orthophosphate dikinase
MTSVKSLKNNEKTSTKYVYPFGVGQPTPPLDKNLLGGKGKGLAEMSSIGIPVPPGFIITTEACLFYRQNEQHYPESLKKEVSIAMKTLEKQMDASFDSLTNPLLVSVRSGARISMPGMMDTVLNLGLNDHSVEGFSKSTGNERLAYDSYRRFISMYANVVDNVHSRLFEDALSNLKKSEKVEFDVDLSVESLKLLCQTFQKIYQESTGNSFPQDPKEQLFKAIAAVFNSWDSNRATAYRQFHQYPHDWGTAVTVQAMVFGNKGFQSATGVGFTRDPASGEKKFYGEFLVNAQGEDVVAGIRTPQPLNKYQKELTHSKLDSLEEIMPETYQQLDEIGKKLEQHYHEMQDVEFTIDQGRLFMLQTRTGKRTGFAAIRIAIEMLDEKLIDERTAVCRVEPNQLTQLLAPVFNATEKRQSHSNLVAKGLNAGPGAASGKAVFSSEKAVEWKAQGIKCILVREETSPEDFPGMVASEGILTIRGGSTSHAAVVARGIGKPCIVGCGDLNRNRTENTIIAKDRILKEGDSISIDGSTGEVFFCHLNTSPSEIVQVLIEKSITPEDSSLFKNFDRIMKLADKFRKLKVRTNADTPEDSEVALSFGAEGIGLCRTEHMFMEKSRLTDVRRMFFSKNEESRTEAISRLLPHQKNDFANIFRKMNGKPVTIRLLDPPQHEFMPHSESELRLLATNMKVSYEELLETSITITESNPMLGHRGCRLGIIYPNLTAMQTRAILEAAIEVVNEGIVVLPEIMVPLISTPNELEHQSAVIKKTADEVFKEKGQTVPFLIGTMIELPRAALTAHHIANHAEFFSFGTNDLTQATFGISRDDSGQFVPLYLQGVSHPIKEEENIQIFSSDPFETIDQEGVGELMQIAISRGKKTNPDLKLGICGEHGGEGRSVTFCHKIGLHYVSCSPFRIPIARLAAAQAALED